MANPEVGVTHDFVLWMNHSTPVGLIAQPFTLRVRRAPTFLPRYSQGAPTGADLTRWKSFVQERFDGGAGQIYYSGVTGNNMFFDSSLIAIGLPLTVPGTLIGSIGAGVTPKVNLLDRDESSYVGDIQAAILPMGTTAQIGAGITSIFDINYRTYGFMMSNAPHVYHRKAAFIYSTFTEDNVWAQNLTEGSTDAFSGKWSVISNAVSTGVMRSAVMFSNVIVSAHGSQLRTYDGKFATPAYSTTAYHLAVYDNKLWTSVPNQAILRYYDPETTSWSAPEIVGETSSVIQNIRPFSGRLLVGKKDSLWIFEGGRLYMVEDFSDQEDDSNFNMMVVHRGALYFNIRHQVYRISTNMLLDLLQTPVVTGEICSGVSVGGDLIMVTRERAGYSRVFILNSESGGVREWFNTNTLGMSYNKLGHRFIGDVFTLGGYVMMAPVILPATFSTDTYTSPFVGALRTIPPGSQTRPQYAANNSYLMTSAINMGLPSVDKQLDKVIVDYNMGDENNSIDVYWRKGVIPAPNKDASASPKILAVTDWRYEADYKTAITDMSLTTHTAFTLFDPNYLFICLENPVSILKFILNTAGCNKPECEMTLQYQKADGTWGTLGFSTNTKNFTQSGTVSFNPPADWASYEPNPAYDVHPTGYWLKLGFGGCALGPTKVVDIVELSTIGYQIVPIDTATGWELLGSITDEAAVRTELSFPEDTTAEEVMLKFEFHGNMVGTPAIRRYVIKYMVIGNPYLDISCSVLAVEPIELLNMTMEHSAAFVQASIFSAAGHGKTFVVGTPWPMGVGTTSRYKISIGGVGGYVPILAYEDSLATGAVIPITLEEA